MASALPLRVASTVGKDWLGRAELSEDEFACPVDARAQLRSAQATVERIFDVSFEIGGVEKEMLPRNEQIWVKMRGAKREVEAAKLFVKGLMNQEEQQEMMYPEALYCVFSGARGLFTDCLIKNTSAQIVVGSAGSLLISGLTEPVVQAYSFVYNLVEKYKNTQGKHAELGAWTEDESLNARRAFKDLAEQWEDQYTMDLLVLPGAVKEILLNMVKDSRLRAELDGKRALTLERDNEIARSPLQDMETQLPGDREWYRQGCPSSAKPGIFMTEGTLQHSAHQNTQSSVLHGILPSPHILSQNQSVARFGEESKGYKGGEEREEVRKVEQLGVTDLHHPFSYHAPSDMGIQRRAEYEERLYGHMPQEMGEEEEVEGLALSVGSRKEFSLQLNFFTAMGYSEHVVRRVLGKTGPKEVSQILDLVQQEQDREVETGWDGESEGGATNAAEDVGRCEEGGMVVGKGGRDDGGIQNERVMIAPETLMEDEEGNRDVTEEDYILTMLKKAAASCGYTEERVMEVYSYLPGLSVGDLLLELQKDELRTKAGDRGGGRAEPWRDTGGGRGPEETGKAEEHKRGGNGAGRAERNNINMQDINMQELSPDTAGKPAAADEPVRQHHSSPYAQIRGPPEPIYSERMPPVKDQAHDMGSAKEKGRKTDLTRKTMVTREQRFYEGLSIPFKLKLADDPGDPGLRQVIIDGSNVAMTHGLEHFFSCRGIALAVQYFWNQGHRKVTTFVPQWRMKKDPRVQERHYVTKLQKLGLLSFTPSREVEGKRINSYDDRFMLQLAQRTGGVIVTNDNLRDLVDESPAWRDIIKKSLLQYTFVGDHFMVPDDPLGRGGPHLKDFLRFQERSVNPGSHTFAGPASSFHPPTRPHAQTEVLHYRDRTPGGAHFKGSPADSEGAKLWQKGRGRGRSRVEVGAGEVGSGQERSTEQTSSLRQSLSQVFPGQDSLVTIALTCNPGLTDVNSLSDIILELLEERAREG